MITLGIDTSNYTTSVALFNSDSRVVWQKKKLLPVKDGEIGIRQSDAVFHHTAALPKLVTELFSEHTVCPQAIGCSDRPREAERSYMPCFIVGSGAAQSIAAVNNIPLCRFSHQQGHIAAAVYSSGNFELFNKKFIAFHVSGGTTEAVLVTPDEEKIIACSYICGSLDLKAGQAIDRVGRMLSLDFPAGAALEKLADKCETPIKTHPVLRGADCCISGVENQCKKLFEQGAEKSYIARYCLEFTADTLIAMTNELQKRYGNIDLLYAGGVMSDTIIKNKIKNHFNCSFAQPEFSCDNAAGIAVLTAIKNGGLCFE